ncbi:aromatic amino acid lyase [Marinivivus vitaminiproducens]|uniref:aromatic amino acid lyase n=1 Tax=Marinivivus vitaminiproducens TaxID=3035935 RepID=UPI0027989BCF|nr:aromatic amino acid lyase [Geminicoccaceae bacterium SCSIO 64248]
MDVGVPVVTLNGRAMSFAAMAGIGSRAVQAVACPDGLARCRAGRAALERAMAAGIDVYGATTGVGAMKDVHFEDDELARFNAGLVRAHHFGTGEPFPLSVVRNAMAIRVNTALTGRVGCTTELVSAYLGLLTADVVPVVRRTGSIGCADIGLMGQIGAMLSGYGEAVLRGQRMPAMAALQAAGLKPVRMEPKDGLASVSVNAVGFAAAGEALRKAASSLRVLLATSLASAGAMGASRDPWKAAAHVGTEREAAIGAWLFDASDDWAWPADTHIQDPLSLRMMSQILGVVLGAVSAAGRTLCEATGRVDDNPVVVEGMMLTSGGSLPLDVTVSLETASIAMAHAARNSFNRCVIIGNGMRRGLPINLVPPGTVATGFGPVIKLAGDLYMRVMSMVQPISPQSMVVAAGIEDEAAFLPLVVERFERQVEAIRRLSALEALLAAQAMDLMADRPKGVVGLVRELVRSHADFYEEDRPLSSEVEAIEATLGSDETMERLMALAPMPDMDDFFALHPGFTKLPPLA